MATEKIVSIDSLSKDERAIVVSALVLKAASVRRSVVSEKNDAVAKLRVLEQEAIQALIARFS